MWVTLWCFWGRIHLWRVHWKKARPANKVKENRRDFMVRIPFGPQKTPNETHERWQDGIPKTTHALAQTPSHVFTCYECAVVSRWISTDSFFYVVGCQVKQIQVVFQRKVFLVAIFETDITCTQTNTKWLIDFFTIRIRLKSAIYQRRIKGLRAQNQLLILLIRQTHNTTQEYNSSTR